MKEKQLLKLALVVGLLGTLGLWIFAGFLEVSPVSIEGLVEDESVIIEGIVTDARSYGTRTVFTLAQLDEVAAVVFDNVTLFTGDYVKVTGTVGSYNNETQLLVDSIVLQ